MVNITDKIKEIEDEMKRTQSRAALQDCRTLNLPTDTLKKTRRLVR